MKTRTIIMAAGKAKRWTGDRPKQLTEFNGEAILYRTIRLLTEAGQSDIAVTVSEELLKLLDMQKMELADIYVPQNNVQEIDRFLSCKEIWGEYTLFLYGDAYYTSEAIDTLIGKYDPPVTFYGRRKRNAVKEYGEMFGLKADTSNPHFEAVLREIREREINGEARGLGWCVFKAYEKRNFVELDSRVEDFDKVDEVERFRQVHNLK
jgi:choline kinase